MESSYPKMSCNGREHSVCRIYAPNRERKGRRGVGTPLRLGTGEKRRKERDVGIGMPNQPPRHGSKGREGEELTGER